MNEKKRQKNYKVTMVSHLIGTSQTTSIPEDAYNDWEDEMFGLLMTKYIVVSHAPTHVEKTEFYSTDGRLVYSFEVLK